MHCVHIVTSLHLLPWFCNKIVIDISVARKFMGGALGHAYLYQVYASTIIIYAPTSNNTECVGDSDVAYTRKNNLGSCKDAPKIARLL